MFTPKIYKSTDLNLMKKIISENAFAALITSGEKIRATHCMMLFNEDDPENTFIETHISRANPQAKTINNGDIVLCDFMGAHTYISSSWYRDINVSTWNYEAVQVYGKIELMSDEEMFSHLQKLTAKYESFQKCPVFVEKMGREFVTREMKGAFGMKVLPTEIYIKQKLSQNRADEDYYNIISELRSSGNTSDEKIAEAMEMLRPRNK